jgi:hypothetical protein
MSSSVLFLVTIHQSVFQSLTYEPMLLKNLTLELEAPLPAIMSTACQIYGSYLSTSLALATHAAAATDALTLRQMHIEKEG